MTADKATDLLASGDVFDELARRAAELGFQTTASDYRRIENRLRSLATVLETVRGIDVRPFEPANTFSAAPGQQ